MYSRAKTGPRMTPISPNISMLGRRRFLIILLMVVLWTESSSANLLWLISFDSRCVASTSPGVFGRDMANLHSHLCFRLHLLGSKDTLRRKGAEFVLVRRGQGLFNLAIHLS